MKKIILLLLSVFLTACTSSSTTNKNFINTKGTTLEHVFPHPKDIHENKVILHISYRLIH